MEFDEENDKILSSSQPKNKAWKIFLEIEAQLKEKLSQVPTPDLAFRLVEETTQIYKKAADCSAKMKGALIGRVKRAAAICRAAACVLVTRARIEGQPVDPTISQGGDDRSLRRENI